MTTRRKIASTLLLIGVLFLGARFLSSSDKLVPATIVYRVPAGATRLESEIHAGDAMLARFAAALTPGQTEARQKPRLPPGTHTLEIQLTDGEGVHATTRTVEIARDAVVTVDLTTGLR
jgi:hypothetical protein